LPLYNIVTKKRQNAAKKNKKNGANRLKTGLQHFTLLLKQELAINYFGHSLVIVKKSPAREAAEIL
jgi:hypothetical protein